ncbi:MAG: hypothetical protein RJB66_2066 [Pseudomonadota bacterium]|jgi:Flp pilus assembly protein TadD
MKQYLLGISSLLLVHLLVGCSSGGNKQKTTSGQRGSSGAEAPSVESVVGEPGSTAKSSSSPIVDVVPSKNELYDGVQMALTSGQDASVEKAIAAVLSQDQNDSKALNSLALFHLSKGRTPLAKMILKNILDKEPKNIAALNNMGVIYGQLGERRQATEFYRKALAVKSNYPIAAANLGAILAGGKDYSKAKKYLEIAYEGGIKDVSLLNNYGAALLADNDSDTQDIFKQALKEGGSDFAVSFNYALYLTYVKKDYKEANEMLDKIRFLGMPANKKSAILKMEETISGSASEESKNR